MAKNKKGDKLDINKITTIVSLLMVVAGMAFWYPAVTGNAIAASSEGFVGYGLLLFVIGLVGAFLSNRK
jgi:hypothetical protein